MGRLTQVIIISMFSSFACGALYEAPSCEVLSERWAKKWARELHLPEQDWVLDADCDGKQASLAYAVEVLTRHLPALYPPLLVAKNIVLAGKSPDESLADTDPETGLISIYDSLLDEGREYIAAQLVHESAHLRPDDIDHVKCLDGPLKDAEAACAAVFTGERKGDAYNFTYFTLEQFYLLGAANPELDRPGIVDAILNLLKSNFNQTPPGLIPKWEGLAVPHEK